VLILDHIAVGAASIEAGLDVVEQALGIRLPVGGQHPVMATHNHLLKLGDGLFLELIAPDPAGQARRPRWFGLDTPPEPPRLLTWVVRAHDIAKALTEVSGSAGPAIPVSRGALSWLIGVPDDGAMPFDGAFPTLIQWPDGPHPAAAMPDLGCRLRRFTVGHPRGEDIGHALAPHFADPRVTIETAAKLRFALEIETPGGLRSLCS
jgi:hypothetical protein